MRIAGINKCDVANGSGIRVSVFVSGCRHHCKNCFNQDIWDFEVGRPYTPEVRDEILELADKLWVDGITILGGEPLEPENQLELVELLETFKERFPTKTIWLYTGFTEEELHNPSCRAHSLPLLHILNLVDVLVDGPYIEELRDPSLRFRGSSNQNIINLH